MPLPSFLSCLPRALALTALVTATPLAAHEFWIEPVSHIVEPGDEIVASLRVGQKYDGENFPYLSSRFERFTVTDTSGTRGYRGHQGDQPALKTEAMKPGLTVLTYVSKPSTLVYRKWETFLNYTTTEGLTEAVEAHLAAELPKTGFREDFQRHTKALIQVGPLDPTDREAAQGLDFELVALGNPFDPDTETLRVQLLRFGEPAPDIQIAIFRKGPDDTTTETLRTDADGYAEITLADGARHLLNAVILEPSEEEGVDYESDWASLTFERP